MKWIPRDKRLKNHVLRSPDPIPTTTPPPSRASGASGLGRGGLPLAHAQPTQTHTYIHACVLTQAHSHARVHTDTYLPGKTPSPHGDLPSPPPDICLAPWARPSQWQRRVLTRWAPSWLTNLETLNRGNRVLPASLPPLAGALGEGQERRKPVNELNELGAGGLGPGGGVQQDRAIGAVPLEVTRV